MTVKIYQLIYNEKDVHMMGDYVGVVWGIKKVKKTIYAGDGVTYAAEVWERKPDSPITQYPYIDFLDIREDSMGDFYADDDSPVQGGLSVKSAMQVAKELAEAVHYIQSKGWEAK